MHEFGTIIKENRHILVRNSTIKIRHILLEATNCCVDILVKMGAQDSFYFLMRIHGIVKLY